MANWYILAYYDELNNMRLFPEVLHVSPGDNVIWASNLDDQYIAGDFSSSTLFPDSGYAMPANNQSSPAQVQPHAADKHAIPYLYTCSMVAKSSAVGDGSSGSGIIIVDPPGTGNGNGKGKKGVTGKKKGR